MQNIYFRNSLLGDELAYICHPDFFAFDVLDIAPLAAEVPHMGAS